MSRLAPPALAALLGAALLPCAASAQVPSSLTGRAITAIRIEGETSGATGADEVGVAVGAVEAPAAVTVKSWRTWYQRRVRAWYVA